MVGAAQVARRLTCKLMPPPTAPSCAGRSLCRSASHAGASFPVPSPAEVSRLPTGSPCHHHQDPGDLPEQLPEVTAAALQWGVQEVELVEAGAREAVEKTWLLGCSETLHLLCADLQGVAQKVWVHTCALVAWAMHCASHMQVCTYQ